MNGSPRQFLMKFSYILPLQIMLALLYVLLAVNWAGMEFVMVLAAIIIAGCLVLVLTELRSLLKPTDMPDLRLWQLLAVAIAMWVLAWLYEVGAILVSGSAPPVPSVADLIRLAGFLAMMAGFAYLPLSEGRRFSMVRDLLDIIIIIGGSFILFFLIVIQSAMEIGIDSPVLILWVSVPPAFDITLVLLALRQRLLARNKIEMQYFGLLALAFALRLPSDLAIGYGLVRPGRTLGQLTDLGWLLSPMAMTLAVGYRREALQSPPLLEGVESSWKRWASRVEALLPASITYLVAGFTLVDYWLIGELDPVAAVSTAVLGILLVARQGVLAGQAEMRKHAALVNAAADLAFICDQTGEILLANPAMKLATGVIPGGKETAKLADLLADSQAESILDKGFEGGWSGEVKFINAQGLPFPVALSLRPVPDDRKQEVMLAGTAHDLTALKQREADLRRALDEVAEARRQLESLNQSLEQKVDSRTQELAETVAHLEELNEELKELDRLKSEFVTLVSHELRGPLTNIRSGVELALSRAESLPTAAEETLSLVSAETERLVSFVEIILDLSALEAGRFPLDLQPIPLAVLARAVASRFPEEKRGRIQVEMSEQIPPVMADEQALTSVLFHLIDNALKYAPAGPVRLRAELQSDKLQISVQDSGPGIPAQERQAVFDRFHRLDSRDSREIYGHGLGLHLSRQLLRAMGGEIEIGDSAEGAQVNFWLPLTEDSIEHVGAYDS